MICWHPVECPMTAMVLLPAKADKELGQRTASTRENERKSEARTPSLAEFDAGLHFVCIVLKGPSAKCLVCRGEVRLCAGDAERKRELSVENESA